jgi:hypothetical protein
MGFCFTQYHKGIIGWCVDIMPSCHMPSCLMTYVGTTDAEGTNTEVSRGWHLKGAKTKCEISWGRKMPALQRLSLAVIHFFEKHFGICTSLSRGGAYRVKDGAATYVRTLRRVLEKRGVQFRTGYKVKELKATTAQSSLLLTKSVEVDGEAFDSVVVAVNSYREIARLLRSPTLQGHKLAQELFPLVTEGKKVTVIGKTESLPTQYRLPAEFYDASRSCWTLDEYNHHEDKHQGESLLISHRFRGIDSQECHKLLRKGGTYLSSSFGTQRGGR